MSKMIVFTPLRKFQFPVMADCINPETLRGKTAEEISALTVPEGNKQKTLGDLFNIEVQPSDNPSIVLNGDFGEVRRVGLGMKNGEITINGNAGMHLGEKMSGGKITVNGNASGWTGSEMKGGLIEIHGNANDYLASPYRGSTAGMKGGKIVVDGNVGSDSAAYMGGGVIRVKGDAGQFLGFGMRNGTVHIEKNAGTRTGASMVGGKIVISGFLEEVLPTFTIDSIKAKVKVEENESVNGPFYVFLGDLADKGNGKLFVSKGNNPQLSFYEKFL